MFDETYKRVEAIASGIDIANLPSVVQVMHRCIGREMVKGETISDLGKEESHILADLLIARLLLEAKPESEERRRLLGLIVDAYREGIREYWWFA